MAKAKKRDPAAGLTFKVRGGGGVAKPEVSSGTFGARKSFWKWRKKKREMPNGVSEMTFTISTNEEGILQQSEKIKSGPLFGVGFALKSSPRFAEPWRGFTFL